MARSHRSPPPLPIQVGLTLLPAAVAVFFLWVISAVAIDAYTLRDAAVVDARVLNVEQVRQRMRRRSRVKAYYTYSYDYAGQHFRSRTSRLTTFSDNDPLHPILDAAIQTGEPVPLFVSRTHPDFSVFSRKVSLWALLFEALFAIAFGSIAVIGVREWGQEWVRRFKVTFKFSN